MSAVGSIHLYFFFHAQEGIGVFTVTEVQTCSLPILSEDLFFFFEAEDGIRDLTVPGVQTCALPISRCGAPPTSISAPSAVTGRPRLAVTLGDPRGIGPEVVAKALAGHPLEAEIALIGADNQIAPISAARRIGVGVWRRDEGEVSVGRIAVSAVEQAVRLALGGEADAIVTGPVHKHALHLAGFRHPGLTEFLGHLAGDRDVAMMLTAGTLRVVLVTTHLPLRDVARAVTTERVVRTGRITEAALRDWWGIARPRLALCALNPHAGESGLFGDEDDRVLRPAAETLVAAGPPPAHTVFA